MPVDQFCQHHNAVYEGFFSVVSKSRRDLSDYIVLGKRRHNRGNHPNKSAEYVFMPLNNDARHCRTISAIEAALILTIRTKSEIRSGCKISK